MEPTIDTFDLTRTGSELSGEYRVAALERLASSLAETIGLVAWRVRGWRARRADGGADDLMTLAMTATVQVPCVRCMRAVPVELALERTYRLVTSEAEAERLDLDDALYDVLAGSRRFDLAGLVEDEAIMALPATPRHERCELPAAAHDPAQPASEDVRERPLAALARLKSGAQNTDIIED